MRKHEFINGTECKLCTLCGHMAPLELFGKDSRAPDGLTSSTRACSSLRKKSNKSGFLFSYPGHEIPAPAVPDIRCFASQEPARPATIAPTITSVVQEIDALTAKKPSFWQRLFRRKV